MDQSEALQRVVRAAIRQRQVVQPGGGGTKGFLHPAATDAVLVSTAEHDGILHYHPDELVIRVRSGTRLVELQETLREAGQYLPCEPPSFGSAGTVGGMVAAGLAGPSRPYVGGVRDYVLGMKLILPSGEIAAFGGDVMKNVAGYDITRLNVGARGSLGLMLEVALKVLPIPEVVQVYGLACDPSLAQQHMLAQRRLAGLSASAYCDGALLVRYQGSEQAKPTFEQALGQGFQPVPNTGLVAVRDLSFAHTEHLWRWDGAVDAPVSGQLVAMDWGGALRWFASDAAPLGAADGGVITWFKQGEGALPGLTERADGVGLLQQRVKSALDPNGAFIGYPGLRPAS
jgi:glycolate oxidase FAD binding subunit